jgi:hypothetical protein
MFDGYCRVSVFLMYRRTDSLAFKEPQNSPSYP